MPIPADLENSAHLRFVRRRAIAVAVFYVAATVIFLLVASPHSSTSPIQGNTDVAMSPRN